MLRALLLGLTIYSFSALAAAPAIDTVGGASNYVTTGAVTIYGGIAGSCTGSDTSLTCNSCDVTPSCTNAPLCPCNTARIWDGMVVRINLKTDNANTYNAVAQVASGTTGTGTDFPPLTPNNGGRFIDFYWSNICAKAGSTGGCDSTGMPNGGSVVIRIGFDKDNSGTVTTGDETVDVTFKILNPPSNYEVIGAAGNSDEGISGFKPYPGDGKVYIEDPVTSNSFPFLNYSTKAKKVRVFISNTSMDNATPLGAENYPADISLTDSGDNLERNVVDGLDNGTLYFFRISLLDEANNVVQFYPAPAILGAECTTAPDSTCAFSATPSEVLGLLSKDVNCFVATAAYGSVMEPKLKVFRDFRYKILVQNKWGLEFVKTYYKYGPYAARYIADKPILRSIMRGLLWPFYGFSYMALKIGFASAFAVSLVLLSSLLALPWYSVRRLRARE
ncbi:MAG: hypothetical protein KF799_04000 [Bdellovibrionales bacterium]|nr:hypothetical protein [Bdellovibrionales bacterium]